MRSVTATGVRETASSPTTTAGCRPWTAPHVLNYPDGFVYAIVREGGRNMPRFGDALSVDERWALVHYLGTLGPTRRGTGEAESR